MAIEKDDDMFAPFRQSILDLDPAKAAELAGQVVKEDIDLVQVIERGYAQGLHTIGEKFEQGEAFLPELMRAAEAMKEAMRILEPELKKRGKARKTLGRIVIGTIEGDLHDIGKNIVAAMFTATGFEVYDLGRNVSMESFIGKVKEVQAHILACSALLTVTMPAQDRLIKRLASEGVRDKIKVMVGGAPVSEAWAKSIGADGYAENAVGAVSVAKRLSQTNRREESKR